MNNFYSNKYHLFFAYGSNMNPEQIAFRCQRPEIFAVAYLPDHAISFHGYTKKWDGSQEGLTYQPGKQLWGIIYKLSFSDMDRLDAWQDARLNGTGAYFQFPTEVIDLQGNSFPVILYKKDILGETQLPSEEYLNYIVSGAVSHRLPENYVAVLEKVATKKATYPVPLIYKFDRSLLVNLSCDCGDIKPTK
jgi:gamma-glutamylcyclotransferase